MRWLRLAAALTIAAGFATGAGAAEAPKPTFQPDGTVKVPAFDLPPSGLMSAEAADMLRKRSQGARPPLPADAGIAQVRQRSEENWAPVLAAMRERYSVDVAEQHIGGVPVRVVTPRGKPVDAKRVLINLHGGGFAWCADACRMLESIPIAAVGGFKVVTVDYRMAPEARHPAGVEDLAAVYAALLKHYKPKQIGVYGCSAGGTLSAQAAAWFPAHGLPQAGAVGIFGSGAVIYKPGDANYLAAYVDGSFAPPPPPGAPPRPSMDRLYFDGSDTTDAIISPALHPEVLAKFPPTLLITGTRAMEMSAVTFTNTQLLKAGVPSTMVVQEGHGSLLLLPSATAGVARHLRHHRPLLPPEPGLGGIVGDRSGRSHRLLRVEISHCRLSCTW